MSGLVVGTILKHSRSRGNDRLVLVVIGDAARDDGSGAWPSIQTIANRAGISERTAQYSIRRLAGLGELAIAENEGPKGAHLYGVQMDVLGFCTGGATGSIEGCKGLHRGGVQGAAPDPSHTSSEIRPKDQDPLNPPSRNGGPCDGNFDRKAPARSEPGNTPAAAIEPKQVVPEVVKPEIAGLLEPIAFEVFRALFPKQCPEKSNLAANRIWLKMPPADQHAACADIPLRLMQNWRGKEVRFLPDIAKYLIRRGWDDALQDATAIPAPAPQRLSPGMQLLKGISERARAAELRGDQGGNRAPIRERWPCGFELDDEMRAYAIDHGLDSPEIEFDGFRDTATATQMKSSDWRASWRKHVNEIVMRRSPQLNARSGITAAAGS